MGRGSISANYYFPPEWDPSKGGLNKFHGVHALRERAKKIDQGILVIRFEMPFDVWCNHCNSHIAMGVRYNAEKKAVGKYFTTTIWEFSMKCHLCGGMLVVQTDPKNTTYECMSGLSKKVEDWNEEDNETLALLASEEKEKLDADPFYKLEHATVPDEIVAKSESLPRVAHLKVIKDARSDDGNLNRQLRKKFREDKKEAIKREKADEEELKRLNLEIKLLPASAQDIEIASQKSFKGPRRHSAFSENKVEKRMSIQSQSIFAGGKARSKGSTSGSTSSTVSSSKPIPPAALAAMQKVEECKKRKLDALHKQHTRGVNPHSLTLGKIASPVQLNPAKKLANLVVASKPTESRDKRPRIEATPNDAVQGGALATLFGYSSD